MTGVQGRHITAEQDAAIRRLRADGHTIARVAEVVGCSDQTVRRRAPGWTGKVPVTPLREAFLASPMTAVDVARELGWWCRSTYLHADSSRVRRTLGISPDVNHGRRSYRTLVDAETVQLIAEAIGVAPWSVMPDDDGEAMCDE